jgi:glutamate N-acetyltransferase/amino-acid N-acetyltransferase
VVIQLHLGEGPGRGTAWGCDLSDQYVRINADYTT